MRGWGRYKTLVNQSIETEPDATSIAPPSLMAILVAFLRLACTSFGGERLGERGERAPTRRRAEPVAPAGEIRRNLRHGRRTSRVARDWSPAS